jgi:hypothetical protein
MATMSDRANDASHERTRMHVRRDDRCSLSSLVFVLISCRVHCSSAYDAASLSAMARSRVLLAVCALALASSCALAVSGASLRGTSAASVALRHTRAGQLQAETELTPVEALANEKADATVEEAAAAAPAPTDIETRSLIGVEAEALVGATGTSQVSSSDDTKSITLSYYVFGLITFGSCIVGSVLAFVAARFFAQHTKGEYD